MTTINRLRSTAASWKSALVDSGGVFLRDVGHGLLEVSHNSLALLTIGIDVVVVEDIFRRLGTTVPFLGAPWDAQPIRVG